METLCRLSGRCAEPAGFSGRIQNRVNTAALSNGASQARFGGPAPRQRLLEGARRIRGPAPAYVAKPDKKVVDPEEDSEWFLKRSKHFDWWRSDWNPVNWDAEEWFQTHTEAPWVEHTQRLIEEGIPITGHQHDMVADKLPHAAPPVLTEWEVYCRRQVDKRWEEEAKAAKETEKWALHWEAQRHPNYWTDLRLIEARKKLPWEWRADWTDEEEQELVGMTNGQIEEVAFHTLKTGDPRFKVSYRDLRPVDLDEVDFLRSIGRMVELDEDLPNWAVQPPYILAARARAAKAAQYEAQREGGFTDGEAERGEQSADLGSEFQDFDPEMVGIDSVDVNTAADLEEDDDDKF